MLKYWRKIRFLDARPIAFVKAPSLGRTSIVEVITMFCYRPYPTRPCPSRVDMAVGGSKDGPKSMPNNESKSLTATASPGWRKPAISSDLEECVAPLNIGPSISALVSTAHGCEALDIQRLLSRGFTFKLFVLAIFVIIIIYYYDNYLIIINFGLLTCACHHPSAHHS